MMPHKWLAQIFRGKSRRHVNISGRLLTKRAQIGYTISWFAIVAQLDRAMVF